jgi:hypothetical protein
MSGSSGQKMTSRQIGVAANPPCGRDAENRSDSLALTIHTKSPSLQKFDAKRIERALKSVLQK